MSKSLNLNLQKQSLSDEKQEERDEHVEANETVNRGQENPNKIDSREERVPAQQNSYENNNRHSSDQPQNERINHEQQKGQQQQFDNFDQFEDAPQQQLQANPQPQEEHNDPADIHKESKQLHPQEHNPKEQEEENSHNVIEQQNQEEQPVQAEEVHNSVPYSQTIKVVSEPPNQSANPLNQSSSHQQENNGNDQSKNEANNPNQSKIHQAKESLSPPSLNSHIIVPVIIKEAQKQRISSTFSIFLKYNIEYQKTVSSYKLIIKNIRTQLSNKQKMKKDLQSSLIQYFETSIKLNKEFYEKSYKIQKEQISPSMNKLINIRQELKQGFQGLFYVRKSLADQMRKLQSYVIAYTINSLNEVFEGFHRLQSAEERRQMEIIDQYGSAQKSLQKVFSTIQKLFRKGMKGDKTKQDIFIQIVKFINQQSQYRQQLIKYGKTILQFKKTFVIGQKQLFTALQRIINEFKVESRKVYAAKQQEFYFIDDYLKEIEEQCTFHRLCTITDVDYIKSVLELQNRKEAIAFTDQHFIHYLDLPFFDRFVGNKKDLFKGAINKCFPLLQKNEELVHTISGNLVHFNRETDQCKDKFQIRYLNAKIFAEGAIQLDELIKGIVFSQNRTIRLKLKDNDRAEELIRYLNEKEQQGK